MEKRNLISNKKVEQENLIIFAPSKVGYIKII